MSNLLGPQMYHSLKYQDLDFMEMYPDGIFLQPEIHCSLMDTIERDCRALESLKIMDYSLLLGIHIIDQVRAFLKILIRKAGFGSIFPKVPTNDHCLKLFN